MLKAEIFLISHFYFLQNTELGLTLIKSLTINNDNDKSILRIHTVLINLQVISFNPCKNL